MNNHYTLYIHGISQIERANPLIVGEPGEKDRSYDWFVIANDGNGAYLSIDLAPQRLGKCYDSAFACHAVAGSCAIVATSFTDLLERAVQNRGQYWWWLGEDFPSMGDAYDA